MIFQKITLDKLGFVSRGRSRHRPRNAPELYGGPYPFVQTADVKRAGLWLTDYEQTYNEVGLAQSKMWPKGTLCITIAANIADTSILGIDACFPDSVIGFIADEKVCDARYIKYYFDCGFQQALQNFSRGAAQDNLSQDKLLSVPLDIPDVESQRRIASILSDYDSAIANARKQIELLEEAAMRLYREWFVENADPKWGEDKFGSLVKINRGKIITKAAAQKGNVPVIAAGLSPAYYTNKANVDAPSVTISASGANAGYVWFHTEDIWASDCSYISRQQTPWVYFSYVFLRSQAEALRGMQKGSAQPHVHASDVEGLGFKMPSEASLDRYERMVGPAFEKMAVLNQQIKSLTEARDRLLPKLMSGEIDVMKGSGK